VSSDTIYALSSGRPPAAIAIIRISGALARAAGEQLAGSLPEPRSAAVRLLHDPETGELLDEALVLRFDGPATATGEDLVELHCHGGRAVVDAVLGALSGFGGLREALPGEFTRRALENGRIDLTEAEGLADLLEAETQSQRRAALLMAEGALSKQIAVWQDKLTELSARAEAAIDYVDEDGVDPDPRLKQDCSALAEDLGEWLDQPSIEPLRDGVRVVIAGPPNSGKSSLINALTGHDKAIVTAVPGTTRDQIEVPLALSGIPMVLTDTAGIRDTDDPVERIGVARAVTAADGSDIVLWLGEPEDKPDYRAETILVHSRADLPDRRHVPQGSIAVSSVGGAGVADLKAALATVAKRLLPAEAAVALNRRQRDELAKAKHDLAHASGVASPELLAEHLRAARSRFNRLTGRAGVEDVLDALFGRFCLGK
jgi:tRNA modification GTPase